MIEVCSLSCRRSARLVFRGVDFRLQSGGILQITGANGSGKSTLLRVLAGLLPADDGEILWHGTSVNTDAATHRQNLHYIGHLDALKPELTGNEMLDYWQALRPTPTHEADDWFGIAAFRHKPVRYLSAGQKRRLALSRLLLNQAPLWLLDEPTTALDVAGQKLLFDAVATHTTKGGMVIAAVHHLLELPNIQTFPMPERT